MIIIVTTIATTTDQVKDLMQYIIIHELNGPINLTITEDGKVNVWQPSNMPVAESVERFPVSDEQLTDIIEH